MKVNFLLYNKAMISFNITCASDICKGDVPDKEIDTQQSGDESSTFDDDDNENHTTTNATHPFMDRITHPR